MNDQKQIITRIVENAIEISDGNLTKLQNHFEKIMGRGNIIENFIVPWACEAERLWEESSTLNEEIDYYDFIDQFTLKKMEELL